VIAHRGASGYLPEHSLAAKALAVGQGADCIEQDVVLTRDGTPVIHHDLTLDATTDVAARFVGRARPDGKHYIADFDLAELGELRVGERTKAPGDAEFPGRFPIEPRIFRLPSLAEELAMIQGLERSLGRAIGIVPELKHPAWHRRNGLDLTRAVIEILDGAGYLDSADIGRACVQCFNPAELERVRVEAGSGLSLVQLMRQRYQCGAEHPYRLPVADALLAHIASYANGIGASLAMLLNKPADATPALGRRANELGLDVLAFTVRADRLPPGFDSLDSLVQLLSDDAGVDGIFTDFPDLVIAALETDPSPGITGA
jgi:glycerophosphoryl diester phosphodiesterase